MIEFKVEQGTPEWHRARAGKITASMFAEVRKRLKSGPNKGGFSNEASKYARRLAVERNTGKVLGAEQFETWAMKRGKEMEEEARLMHEEMEQTLIVQAGLIATDCERYGASVDGFIGKDGMTEYKCYTDPMKFHRIVIDHDLSEEMDQIQGGMWITGRTHCEFGFYNPDFEERPLFLFSVARDDAYIAELVADLEAFNAEVEKLQAVYRAVLERKEKILIGYELPDTDEVTF